MIQKNLLKEVLKHEVFPALGCTEPIAVAYAASVAGKEITGKIKEIVIRVDLGVYKNGKAVTVPNTGGEKGNLIAGVLGALVKKPELKMEILSGIKKEMIKQAKSLISAKKAELFYDKSKTDLYIDVFIKSERSSARAVIEGGHTNVVRVEKNKKTVFAPAENKSKTSGKGYKKLMKKMKLSELVDLVKGMDKEDYAFVKQGIEMNLKVSEAGHKLKKVGYYLSELVKKEYLIDDILSYSKALASSAADARMAGLNLPVMTSGGSGNQGIVSILVPYNVGKHFKIKEKKVLRSIALSHLINSYIKCFTGDLSPLCGCAIAAGVGAAVAIVYQLKGKDIKKMNLAINNIISDLGGMFCDGAKGGCALKVASSVDSAIISAYMAVNNYGISEVEGFVGKTGESTIRNLSIISETGMEKVNDTIIKIMFEKNL